MQAVSTLHEPANTLAATLLGTFKTFGASGPAYEVLAGIKSLPANDWLMHVRVLESGEELDLPASQIARDPAAV
jgi:Family of unknown function (DUF5397)